MAADGVLYSFPAGVALDPEQRQALVHHVLDLNADTKSVDTAAALLADWLEDRHLTTRYGVDERDPARLRRLIAQTWRALHDLTPEETR